MKQKRLNKIITLLITVLVFAFCAELKPQSNQPEENQFPVGSFMSRNTRTSQAAYNAFELSGMNTMVQYAADSTKPFLANYNIIAYNQDRREDWIQYYATGYYSRWEAEQDQQDSNRIGIKHKYGQAVNHLGRDCWSSAGLTHPADSLMYGPHYRQEKRYKRWLFGCNPNDCVAYIARFNMALDFDPLRVSNEEPVCKIKVVYRYSITNHSIPPPNNYTLHDTVFLERTLRIGDFNADGSFRLFDFVEQSYEYDSRFTPRIIDEKMDLIEGDNTSLLTYSDSDADNGIQFFVEWLRDDDICTLFIDYAEVYDTDGWNAFVSDTTEVVTQIQSYVQNYPQSEWPNLKYWYSQDEPYTIDAFVPMRTVDSLVRDAGGAPLITEFYPSWNSKMNGDWHPGKFTKTLKIQGYRP